MKGNKAFRVKRLNRRRLLGGGWVADHVCGLEVTEGGWSKAWMRVHELLAVSQRAKDACYKTALPEDETLPYGPFQCGGCRWFAAVDDDWGLCCCAASPHDCRMVFGNGGCRQHSVYVRLVAAFEIKVKP